MIDSKFFFQILPSGMQSMGSNRSIEMRSRGGEGGGGGRVHDEDILGPGAKIQP